MVYQWKIPNLYDIPAQDAGAEIESCKDNDGFIKPEVVVEKAKAPTNVLHGCFEWDDDKAAARYRLHQASDLIRNIVTINVAETIPDTPVRAFVNIKGEAERGYKTISAVVRNQGEYDYMLRCAMNELRAFTQKYAALTELGAVMAAIREALL